MVGKGKWFTLLRGKGLGAGGKYEEGKEEGKGRKGKKRKREASICYLPFLLRPQNYVFFSSNDVMETQPVFDIITKIPHRKHL